MCRNIFDAPCIFRYLWTYHLVLFDSLLQILTLTILLLDHGSRKFVQISMLEDQGFMDRNGEFQLEFTLSNIHSTFEHKFRINQSIFAANSSKMTKLETSYFSFGIYDWSMSVYPTGRSDSQLGKNSR